MRNLMATVSLACAFGASGSFVYAAGPDASSTPGSSQPSEPTAPKFRIGDPVPPLQGDWLKGSTRAGFEKGKIYVLDFWATWCGACMISMPKFSEIARAQKDKADFIAVNIWENKDVSREKLKEFIRVQKSSMDSAVIADVQDGDPKKREGPISREWLRSANINSIPTVMIVDREGRLAWIGRVEGLTEAIDAIHNGDWNLVSARAEYEQQATASRARLTKSLDDNQKLSDTLELSKSDPAAALKVLDELIAKAPYRHFYMDQYRIAILMRLDEEQGVEAARTFMKKQSNSPETLETMSGWISSIDGLKAGGPAYTLALRWSEASLNKKSYREPGSRDPRVQTLMTHAAALWRNGRSEEAAAEQEKAVAIMKTEPGFSPGWVTDSEERVKLYRDGANPK